MSVFKISSAYFQRLRLRTVPIALALLVFLFSSGEPRSLLLAQPVPVPALGTNTFQTTDFDPTFATAGDARSQANWETLVEQGKVVLSAAWEASADAAIDAQVLAVSQSDYFNSTAEYRDYLRSELSLQKQTAFAAWEAAADAQIEAERGVFLDQLAGRNQFSQALSEVDRKHSALLAALDQRDQEFAANRARIDAYEQTVRTNIQTTIASMRGYLTTNDFFYQENCVQSTCTVDRSTRNAAGDALQTLIDTVQTQLDNDDPLSLVATTMRDYIQPQRDNAETTQRDWFNRISGTTDRTSVPIGTNINPHGGTDPTARYNTGNARWYVANQGTRFGLIDWGAINSNQGLRGFLDYANSGQTNTAGLFSFIKSAMGLWGEVTSVDGGSADLCGAGTGGYNGQNRQMFGLCWYRSAYHDSCRPSCNYFGGSEVFVRSERHNNGRGRRFMAVSHAENAFHLKVRFSWFDVNAQTNSNIWQGYLDDLNPLFDHWNDNILPAIENWEAQVATFEANHSAWQAQAATQRADAITARNQRVDELVSDRNRWLTNMRDEYRSGLNQWSVVLSRASANGSGGDAGLNAALAGIQSPAQIAALRIVGDEAFAARNAANLAEIANRKSAASELDFSAIENLNSEFARSARGLQQFGLASAISERAAEQRERAIAQSVALLEGIDGVTREVGDETEQR